MRRSRSRRRVRRHATVATTLLVLVLVLVGCDAAGSGGAVPPPAVPATVTSAPTPSAPAPDDGTITVAGVVRPGVLPRCAVLTTDDGRRFVLDGAPDAPLGVPVTVRGVVDPDTASYCNAGVTLRVRGVAVR